MGESLGQMGKVFVGLGLEGIDKMRQGCCDLETTIKAFERPLFSEPPV